MKLAINGFGRIGRNILRSIAEHERKDIEVIAINDLAPPETCAHLLKYDTMHGHADFCPIVSGGTIDIGAGPIKMTSERNPADLNWSDIDIVMECTGKFTNRESVKSYFDQGVRKVLISAPASDADKTIVYGINHDSLDPEDKIISNASCTTNCLAPVVKVLNDAIGIETGFMTTVHSYTGDQPTLDREHKDLYRARAAALNMIPTSTGAARAVSLVLPEMAGKLDGVAIRVPTPNVSCVDLTFQASRDTNRDEINDVIDQASKGSLQKILGISDEKLVSMDFNHDSRSSILAADQTHVVKNRTCRILSWYDNEWGFANRMVDTAQTMAKFL